MAPQAFEIDPNRDANCARVEQTEKPQRARAKPVITLSPQTAG
jgi:hypothetical protein